MLKGLIRTRTARKVLTVFFVNPNDKFYIRQLERLTKEPVNAVRRELIKLEEAGILLSKDEARVKNYWVNRDSPIFEEIRSIILKTQGLGDSLRQLVKNIPEIKAAFIYGSVAKGEDKATSDVDLMVVGDIDSVRLHSKINAVENKIKRTINYSLMSPAELKSRKSEFIKRVLRDKKIFLVGSESDL